ncbi:MAG: hypothetical protein KKC46_11670 [Proteobacteria bacterium]|nr:hypothetical protein [Pseudomonadota bacterium]
MQRIHAVTERAELYAGMEKNAETFEECSIFRIHYYVLMNIPLAAYAQ